MPPLLKRPPISCARSSEEVGELFPELWAELNVGEPPEWLAELRKELKEKKAAGSKP